MVENQSFNPELFKAKARDTWNAAARGWDEHTPQIHDWLADPTQRMLDLASIKSGFHVLDVAAGAGDQTLSAAERTGPTGNVLATDISPAILELAAANARKAGLNNIEFKVADAENLDLPAESFDAAICRLGLMLCPNPAKVLDGVHHALKPGSRACTLVFSQPDKNPSVGILIQLALKHTGLTQGDPYQPGGLFSLSKPGTIDELFTRAGFQEVSTTVLSAPFNLPSSSAYMKFMRSSAGPIIQMLSKLGETERNAAWNEMEERLNIYNVADGWQGPNELLLTVGRVQH
ncbi:class I SAM-dependent methyltransferase [Pusillimonas sp. ANT_WB101]|uniref:class I SAM-dependent methyltransferase n=1 Tax=Pusillimonas sp. ANT_WB101 TaxID=2597356 RepID=UPI0011EF4A6F|nr:methyltransferase domain-containing protein [Pusillimonas sp. ANT_WB101]KAA0911522.1 methyltransferase domain-containing protein [Pusillimonas sp. ANT_WB101]